MGKGKSGCKVRGHLQTDFLMLNVAETPSRFTKKLVYAKVTPSSLNVILTLAYEDRFGDAPLVCVWEERGNLLLFLIMVNYFQLQFLKMVLWSKMLFDI